MMNKIWRYSLNDGESGGIIIADDIKEARRKVEDMYEDYDGDQDSIEEDEIKVWNAWDDEYYSKDYPDVLEIYGV